jgi:L-alanine-DL-glutamate epimerase-like enolase superfamily enzyme
MNHTISRRARLGIAFAPQAATARPDAGDTVSEMRWFPVREPVSGNRYTFLRVKTRSGLTGWGECAYAAGLDVTSWIEKRGGIKAEHD